MHVGWKWSDGPWRMRVRSLLVVWCGCRCRLCGWPIVWPILTGAWLSFGTPEQPLDFLHRRCARRIFPKE